MLINNIIGIYYDFFLKRACKCVSAPEGGDAFPILEELFAKLLPVFSELIQVARRDRAMCVDIENLMETRRSRCRSAQRKHGSGVTYIPYHHLTDVGTRRDAAWRNGRHKVV